LHRLPGDLRTRLAGADDVALAAWASEWSRAGENLHALKTPEVIAKVLSEVRELCRRADRAGNTVYDYTSL
jgi:hypothetical protein